MTELSFPLHCNREHMLLLVEALESGEYLQGMGALRTVDEEGKFSYCCAGVACEISRTGHWDSMGRCTGYPTSSVSYTGSNSSILPVCVVKWLDLRASDGSDTYELQKIPLPDSEHPWQVATSLNDRGVSFREIAARLRRVYLTSQSPSPSAPHIS